MCWSDNNKLWNELTEKAEQFLTEKAIKQYIAFAKTQLREVKEKKNKKKLYNYFRLMSEAKKLAKGKRIVVYFENESKNYQKLKELREKLDQIEFESSSFQLYLQQADSLLEEIDNLKPWKPLQSLNSLKKTTIWLEEWIKSYRSAMYVEEQEKRLKN